MLNFTIKVSDSSLASTLSSRAEARAVWKKVIFLDSFNLQEWFDDISVDGEVSAWVDLVFVGCSREILEPLLINQWSEKKAPNRQTRRRKKEKIPSIGETSSKIYFPHCCKDRKNKTLHSAYMENVTCQNWTAPSDNFLRLKLRVKYFFFWWITSVAWSLKSWAISNSAF